MTTNHSILAAFEDAEQAHILSHPDIVLHYTIQGVVLTGPDRGRDIRDVTQRIVMEGRYLAFRLRRSRPWWRLWRLTETMTVTVQAEGFGQAFDDGGSHD